MGQVALDLDNLIIHELSVAEASESNAIDFTIKGTIRDLDEDTVAAVVGKRLVPVELTCRTKS